MDRQIICGTESLKFLNLKTHVFTISNQWVKTNLMSDAGWLDGYVGNDELGHMCHMVHGDKIPSGSESHLNTRNKQGSL